MFKTKSDVDKYVGKIIAQNRLKVIKLKNNFKLFSIDFIIKE